jgi:preprotein translocase SecE subunit
MSIIQTKNENLQNSPLVTDLQNSSPITETVSNIQPKKVGFIRSSFQELKLVKWPTFKHVLYWSFMVVLFTTVFSSVLGVTDHILDSGTTFIECTSSKGKARDLPTCSSELLKNIFSVSK